MEPAGGVHQHHIGIPGLGGRHGVENHGGRVGPLLLLDDVHPRPVSPDGELVGSGGPEGVGGAEKYLFPLPPELMADLADGGGFAHPVHPDKQHHRGLGGQVQGQLPGAEGVGDDPDHYLPGPLHGLDPLRTYPAAQLLHQLQGDVHAGVRQNQRLLQLVVEVVGELRAEAGENVDLF